MGLGSLSQMGVGLEVCGDEGKSLINKLPVGATYLPHPKTSEKGEESS